MPLERTLSAGYMTNWAARLFAVAIERRLKARGLSSAHLPVFFALADGAARTQKDLAAAAAVEQPTMAATLARMERDGLIRRAPDPADGRSSLVSLTETALADVDAVRRATDEVNALALADLAPSERDIFLSLLEKVVTALAADAPEKPPRAARRKATASTADGSP
ncbi:MAG: MarR family winged helix-turn-helix transcriptional regulator [Hyphomicrobiales bacterium]|nr:MarR family winged helix-turn-helix transcriptional regulator [Hyphomicrobiales bacterium]